MMRIESAACGFTILNRRVDKNLSLFSLKFVHDHQSAYRAWFSTMKYLLLLCRVVLWCYIKTCTKESRYLLKTLVLYKWVFVEIVLDIMTCACIILFYNACTVVWNVVWNLPVPFRQRLQCNCPDYVTNPNVQWSLIFSGSVRVLEVI